MARPWGIVGKITYNCPLHRAMGVTMKIAYWFLFSSLAFDMFQIFDILHMNDFVRTHVLPRVHLNLFMVYFYLKLSVGAACLNYGYAIQLLAMRKDFTPFIEFQMVNLEKGKVTPDVFYFVLVPFVFLFLCVSNVVFIIRISTIGFNAYFHTFNIYYYALYALGSTGVVFYGDLLLGAWPVSVFCYRRGLQFPPSAPR